MFDGDGMEIMEMQARKIAENATEYKGSSPCPACGVILNPVEAMYSKGMCPLCYAQKMSDRVKRKMV
jgi:rubrerythrin